MERAPIRVDLVRRGRFRPGLVGKARNVKLRAWIVERSFSYPWNEHSVIMVTGLHCWLHMKKARILTIPEIGLIAGTRAMAGVGIGLLISDRFRRRQRKKAGWVLFGIGALSTIPIVMEILGKSPRIDLKLLKKAAA